jgi:hypothetical protein
MGGECLYVYCWYLGNEGMRPKVNIRNKGVEREGIDWSEQFASYGGVSIQRVIKKNQTQIRRRDDSLPLLDAPTPKP